MVRPFTFYSLQAFASDLSSDVAGSWSLSLWRVVLSIVRIQNIVSRDGSMSFSWFVIKFQVLLSFNVLVHLFGVPFVEFVHFLILLKSWDVGSCKVGIEDFTHHGGGVLDWRVSLSFGWLLSLFVLGRVWGRADGFETLWNGFGVTGRDVKLFDLNRF